MNCLLSTRQPVAGVRKLSLILAAVAVAVAVAAAGAAGAQIRVVEARSGAVAPGGTALSSGPIPPPITAPSPASQKPVQSRSTTVSPANVGTSSAAGLPPRVELINEAIEQTAPLTREELLMLRRELARRGLGMTENISGKPPPRPSSQVFELDLSPSANTSPPVVRLTPGQGAVVSFLDAGGAAWPVVLADNAAADAGVVVQTFTAHQLSVFVRNHTAMGNVLVALEGLPSAVSFTVVSGQAHTDYQVQLVVPRFKDGPPAHVVSTSSVPLMGTADLFDYLLRTPPPGARALKVVGLADTMAWQTGPTTMVVRTPALITRVIRHFSLDGMGVYEVQLSPLVVASHNGKLVELTVSGF
jgi:intracellular multiplication protein IcmK